LCEDIDLNTGKVPSRVLESHVVLSKLNKAEFQEVMVKWACIVGVTLAWYSEQFSDMNQISYTNGQNKGIRYKE
jgi:hypothetical protein